MKKVFSFSIYVQQTAKQTNNTFKNIFPPRFELFVIDCFIDPIWQKD